MFRRIELIGRYDPDRLEELAREMEEWWDDTHAAARIRATPLDYKCGLTGSHLFGPDGSAVLLQMNAPRRTISKNCRFFFTEEGWRRYGRPAVEACGRMGLGYRVLAVKERSVEVVYRDEVQVAVRPRKKRESSSQELRG